MGEATGRMLVRLDSIQFGLKPSLHIAHDTLLHNCPQGYLLWGFGAKNSDLFQRLPYPHIYGIGEHPYSAKI